MYVRVISTYLGGHPGGHPVPLNPLRHSDMCLASLILPALYVPRFAHMLFASLILPALYVIRLMDILFYFIFILKIGYKKMYIYAEGVKMIARGPQNERSE